MHGSLVRVRLVHRTATTFVATFVRTAGLALEVHPASEAQATSAQIAPSIRPRVWFLFPFICRRTFAGIGMQWITLQRRCLQ